MQGEDGWSSERDSTTYLCNPVVLNRLQTDNSSHSAHIDTVQSTDGRQINLLNDNLLVNLLTQFLAQDSLTAEIVVQRVWSKIGCSLSRNLVSDFCSLCLLLSVVFGLFLVTEL
jgi:hypothetical protein